MKTFTKQLLALAAVTAFAAPVSAVPFGDGGAALQGVLDGITVSGTSSVTAATDFLADTTDSNWQIGGSGGSISTIVVELAGFAGGNTFGIYDTTDFTNKVELFAGADSSGDQSLLSILADGTVNVNFANVGMFAGNSFGYYLDSSVFAGGGVWFSETSLNSDGIDHMAAYQGVGDEIEIAPFSPGPWGSSEYILAWEDLNGGGDRDFTDFVVLVESVSPTPAPLTLSLLGFGLMGVGFASRRRRQA